MSLASPLLPFNNTNLSLPSSTADDHTQTEATLTTLLGAFTNSTQSMDRGATEYSQSGLPTPYPNAFIDAQSEDSPADHASAVQFAPQHEVRSNNYSTSATPTSEYGVYPASARSGSFPEHIQRHYHPASNHSGSSGGMAQPTSPSSQSLQDGRSNHHNPQIKSDQDVPIDPSIAASSPTYPPHGGQYSPYPPQQDMQHGYPSHPGGAMYTQPRPDWAGYGGHPQHPMQGGYQVTGAQTPTSAAPAGARPGQVSKNTSPPLAHIMGLVHWGIVGHWVSGDPNASTDAPGSGKHKVPVSFYETCAEVSASRPSSVC